MCVLLQKLTRYQIGIFLAALLLGSSAYAQGPSLSLASGSAVKGGTLSLNLSLNAAANAPAGLQWTISYAPADITSLSAVAGPALTAAGEALNCISGGGSLTCLATGMTDSTISSGVVAVVTATLSSASTDTLDALTMTYAMGTLPDGTYIGVSGTGGTISVLPTVSALQCVPATLTSGQGSTCTVTLSLAAPTGGSSVAVSDNNTALTVPTSVTVAAGSTTANFTATAGTVASNQSVTVTASLNGASATSPVTVTPQITVTTLQCTPAAITSGG